MGSAGSRPQFHHRYTFSFGVKSTIAPASVLPRRADTGLQATGDTGWMAYAWAQRVHRTRHWPLTVCQAATQMNREGAHACAPQQLVSFRSFCDAQQLPVVSLLHRAKGAEPNGAAQVGVEGKSAALAMVISPQHNEHCGQRSNTSGWVGVGGRTSAEAEGTAVQSRIRALPHHI